MDAIPDQLQQAGINVDTLKKGDFFSREQVILAYSLLNPKVDERIERFEHGEIKADPRTWAGPFVIDYITHRRSGAGRPVVCRCEDGGIRVLTDSQAAPYLNKQATAGLKKHSQKTRLMQSAIDMSGLNPHEQAQHSSRLRVQQFMCSAHENARKSLREKKESGVEDPDRSASLGQHLMGANGTN